MDQLTTLLNRFSLHAGVFYTGNICGIHDFQQDSVRGHLHLIRRGPVLVMGVRPGSFTITEPALLFLPRPDTHRLIADERSGADVVCGTVQFGGGSSNPITASLPSVVMVELRRLPGVEALLGLMFDEAFAEQDGRQAVLDRLCEVLMIQLLRYCIAQHLTRGGALAGLADARLAKALNAMHLKPEQAWRLEDMAALAGMSRARFAVHFHQVTGETPADYLASWRVLLAQGLLQRGLALKHVAGEVGYGSPSALTRAFQRKLGCAPGEWLKGTQAQ
ncbi:AraC family transcriptional regulator [Rhodoferax sp.]|uniref:AraC family transcriptional regulator n=1 Tax=Rhodoferax sp. TaxID=50421 RepID=UPI00260FE55F|nr:AraC family transcriptional regulator [Rhodoferax sp.]MDD2919516.1 AraC family transcriptional regulator [Rhodoferax sp.]